MEAQSPAPKDADTERYDEIVRKLFPDPKEEMERCQDLLKKTKDEAALSRQNHCTKSSSYVSSA